MVSRIAVTPGEPAGIGPDLIIQLAQTGQSAELVVVADPDLLEQRAKSLSLPLKIQSFNPETAPEYSTKSSVSCLPVPLNKPATAGKLDSANAEYVLETLRQATDGCLSGQFDALVTGPVHKAIINEAGIPFTGHTEFLAARCGEGVHPVMMLAADGLRVALVTTHLPLNKVSAAITSERLEKVCKIVQSDLLERFQIDRPRILVCGLNPHAGEDGHLGMEEIEIITPVLDRLRDQGMEVTGPLPADTLFTRRNLKNADAVLAMYHDQGLPVLKYAGFGQAVNITLGLPIIRTSVDHGTALELAATGKAEIGSLIAAIAMAQQMIQG